MTNLHECLQDAGSDMERLHEKIRMLPVFLTQIVGRYIAGGIPNKNEDRHRCFDGDSFAHESEKHVFGLERIMASTSYGLSRTYGVNGNTVVVHYTARDAALPSSDAALAPRKIERRCKSHTRALHKPCVIITALQLVPPVLFFLLPCFVSVAA